VQLLCCADDEVLHDQFLAPRTAQAIRWPSFISDWNLLAARMHSKKESKEVQKKRPKRSMEALGLPAVSVHKSYILSSIPQCKVDACFPCLLVVSKDTGVGAKAQSMAKASRV